MTFQTAIHEVKVKSGGARTRLAKLKNKPGEGVPDIQPTPKEDKVTRKNGEKLRVGAASMPGFETEHQDGRVQGANKKWYYYVTNDAFNGDAADLYVRVEEVKILRTGFLHTVQRGETLWGIAQDFDKTDADLVKKIHDANRDVIGNDANQIRRGQVLFIPNG